MPKKVLVTGASLGIGRAIALAAAASGARVVLAARRREGLEAVAAEIAASGGRAEVLPFDAADPAAILTDLAEFTHLVTRFRFVPSLPSFGEAVFRPTTKNPQEEKSRPREVFGLSS